MAEVNWSDWEAVGTTSPEGTDLSSEWEVDTEAVNTGQIPLDIMVPREGVEMTRDEVIAENVQGGVAGDAFPILEGLQMLESVNRPLPTPSPDMYENLDLAQSKALFDFYMKRRDDDKSLEFRPTYQGAVIPNPPLRDLPFVPDRTVDRTVQGLGQGLVDGAYEIAETAVGLQETFLPMFGKGLAQYIDQNTGRVDSKKFADEFVNEAGRQIPALVGAGYAPVSKFGKFAIEQVVTTAATDEETALGIGSALIRSAPKISGDLLEGDEFGRQKSIEKLGLLIELSSISAGLVGSGQAIKAVGKFGKRGIADPISAQFTQEGGKKYIDGELLASLAEPLDSLDDNMNTQAFDIIRNSLKNIPEGEEVDTLKAVIDGIETSINAEGIDGILKERLTEVSQRALKMRKSTALNQLPDVDRIERQRTSKPIKQTDRIAKQFDQEAAEQVPELARKTAGTLRDRVDEMGTQQSNQLDIESRRGIRNIERVGNIGPKVKQAREGGALKADLDREYTNLIDSTDQIEEGIRKQVDDKYNVVKQLTADQPVDQEVIDEFNSVAKTKLEDGTTYDDLLDNIDALNKAYDKSDHDMKGQILALKDRILYDELDDMITSEDIPPETVDALNDARSFYRDEYANRFVNTENTRDTGLALIKSTKGSGRTTEAGRASRLKELKEDFRDNFSADSSNEPANNLISTLRERGNAEDRSRVGRIIAGESALRIKRIMDTTTEFNLENDQAVNQVLDTLQDYRNKVTGKEAKKIGSLIETLKSKNVSAKQKREALDQLIKERHTEVKRFTNRVVRPFLNEEMGTNLDEAVEGPLSSTLEPSAASLDTQMDEFFRTARAPNKMRSLVKRMEDTLSPEEVSIAKEGLKRATLDKLSRLMDEGAGSVAIGDYRKQREGAFALLDALDLTDDEKVVIENLKEVYDEVFNFSVKSEKAGSSITPSGLSGAMGSAVPDETKGALNKVISIVWGVLNPTATKLRQGAGVLTGNYGNREEFFRAYVNQVLSDPKFYAEKLDALESSNASRKEIMDAIGQMTYRVLQTSSRTRTNFDSFESELDRMTEEFEMDRDFK